MARSHKDKIIRALSGEPHEKATFERLAGVLGGEWTPEQVEAKVRQFDADDDVPLNVVRGGVQYFGSERGAKPGLYKEIRRGIQRRWGRDNSMRNISVLHSSRTSQRGSGYWSQPDLIARVDRRSDAKPPIVYLAIEVEQPDGFGIASVYQAYEVGRGADFSWVFYCGPQCTGRLWDRIETAARDLGVGIVHAARPTQPSNWRTVIGARIREHTQAEQDDFLTARCGVEPDDFLEPS
jgi:hypothetical protein